MSSQPSLISVAEDVNVQRPSSYSQWQFFRDTAAAGAGTYWAMNKDGVKELIGGGAPASTQLFVNALVVDAVYGNDATAIPHSFMDVINNPAVTKFKTIAAAAAQTTSRDLIIVYPGVYAENTNLFINNAVYYFYPEAQVSCTFENTDPGATCAVYGSGIFDTIENEFVNITAGRLYMEGESFSNGTLNGNVFTFGALGANNLAPILIVNSKMDIYSDSSCVRMQATGPFAMLQVTCGGRMFHTTVSPSNEMIDVNGPGGETCFQGKAYIKSVGGFWGSPNYNAAGGTLIELNNANENGAMAMIQIDGDLYDVHPGIASTRPFVTCEFSEFTRIIINGNLYGQNQQALRVLDSPTGNTVLTWNGNIYTERQILTTANAFGTASHQEIQLNGESFSQVVTSNMTINGAGTQVPKVVLNGATYNATGGGAGITKTLAASLLIFNNYKIVTGGGPAVVSGVGDTYSVIHSLARNNANTNAVNLIVGSVDYVDVNVI